MSALIKKANQLVSYTPEQLIELKRCTEDPIYFMRNYIYILHPKQGKVKFDLYPYQEKAVRAFQNNRWVITLQSRQSGKTTIIAMYMLWYAIFHKDQNVLVASNKNNNAMEIISRIKYAFEELPHWLIPGCVYYTQHHMEFDNKSKIWSEATTDQTGRGKSVSLLMLDELAFVSAKIQTAMWSSVAPTLSTGGSCIISSTPNGDDDLFARLWRQSTLDVASELGNGEVDSDGDVDVNFVPVEVHWTEHPNRDEKFKRTMIGKLGELQWRQEFENEFLSSDELLIKSTVLYDMKPKRELFIDKGIKFYKDIRFTTYVIGMDVSEGSGGDFSTIQVFELDTLEQVAEYRSNTVNETQLYNCLKYIIQQLEYAGKNPTTGAIPDIYWSFENNGPGASINTLYMNDENFSGNASHVTFGNRRGLRTTYSSKSGACNIIKKMIEKPTGMKISSPLLIAELKNYVRRGVGYAAKSGATDDLISAVLIIGQILGYLTEHDEEVFEKVYNTEQDFYDETTDSFDEPMPFVMS